MTEKKLSGAEAGEENFKRFESWLEMRNEADDWYKFINGSKLNRSEIVRQLGFKDTSILRRNPRIKSALRLREDQLRREGVLTEEILEDAQKASDRREQISKTQDKQRIKKLEEQVQALSAENEILKEKLSKADLLQEHIQETGRLLRL